MRLEVARLAQLTKELRSLEAQLDDLLGVVPEPESESLNERVLDILEANPAKEFLAEEIATPLSAKIPSVRAALSRLASQNRISKNGRGKYQILKQAILSESEATVAA